MSALGVGEISVFSVSKITRKLDEKVEELLSKPIKREILYLYIDSTYFSNDSVVCNYYSTISLDHQFI